MYVFQESSSNLNLCYIGHNWHGVVCILWDAQTMFTLYNCGKNLWNVSYPLFYYLNFYKKETL